MADYTVSRVGYDTTDGTDASALFLKVFAGEVLTAFNTNNVGMGVHRVRTISSGKSAQFPLTGLATATSHTAGNEITGGSIDHAEREVTISGLKIASAFVASIDDARNHYDVRSAYSTELGNALAKQADEDIFTAVKAASADTGKYALGAAHNGGSVEIAGTSGTNVADALFSGLQKLDEGNVTGERFIVVNPEYYWRLFSGTLSNVAAVMNSDVGGEGSLGKGTVPVIGGAKVLTSNNLPSGTKALVFTKDAAATVKLMDLAVESDYQIQRQGTLLVARYAMGTASLRPDCAVEIIDAE